MVFDVGISSYITDYLGPPPGEVVSLVVARTLFLVSQRRTRSDGVITIEWT